MWGSSVLLFPEFINIVFILFYNFTELNILLYTFLVIFFAWYKEYIICLISFSKFAYVLRASTWASAIGNLWSICLGVNVLSYVPKSKGQNLLILLKIFHYWKNPELIPDLHKEHLHYFFFLVFFSFGLVLLLNCTIFSKRLLCFDLSQLHLYFFLPV